MQLPPAATRQSEITAAVEAAVKNFSRWVVRIRYDIQQDWSGEWGIFFKVVVADNADIEELPNLSFHLRLRLGEKLDWQELGVIPYFNFRRQSEQERMLEPAWT